MQMHTLNMCALSYCGARDLLCEIRLDYFNSMCTRAAKCLVKLYEETQVWLYEGHLESS